jgi:hypothetical protein
MKTKFFLITLLTIGLFSFTAFKVADNELLGIWKYKISDVPVEYQTGVMSFEKKDDVTIGVIGDGDRKTEMKELTIKENNISFKLAFESGEIVVTLVKDGDKMSGKLKTQDGEFALNAEKQVAK